MQTLLNVRFAPDGLGPAPTAGGAGGVVRTASNGPAAAPAHHADGEAKPQIKFNAGSLGGGHGAQWKRKTNLTGTGATHVKTFHCRLAEESVEYLDRQVNEWLDAHPEYEVKFVTTQVGDWTGKLKEPQLIVQVWV